MQIGKINHICFTAVLAKTRVHCQEDAFSNANSPADAVLSTTFIPVEMSRSAMLRPVGRPVVGFQNDFGSYAVSMHWLALLLPPP